MATLEAARDRCIETKTARVPQVQYLGVGDRCELAFVLPDQKLPNTIMRGVVTEVHDDPPGISVAIKPRLTRRRKPAATTSDLQAELRGLPVAKAVKLARTANQRERTFLERTYGKVVWPALLSNPKITVPEVARIARKRALPRPLLAEIVDNPTWATAPIVRRAALANPRLSTAMATALLRQCPKSELKLATKQAAYPMAIRELARKLLDG